MRRAILLVCLFGSACAARTRIVVPPEAAREWSFTPSGEGRGRHVIRMSDGTRDWEVEFPDVATGYEVRIPLRGAPADGQPGPTPAGGRLTAADRELLEERALSPGGGAEAAAPAPGMATTRDGRSSRGKTAPAAAPARPRASYLGGGAHIRELYRTRNYELALVECVDLEREYPNDAKLLAMKGSIYRKLGKPRLARETWQKALLRDPENTAVAEALRELASEGNADRADDARTRDDEEGGR